jgi:hypothetical protein
MSVIYTVKAKAMGGQVGNQMLGQSCMESILKGLHGGPSQDRAESPAERPYEDMCGANPARQLRRTACAQFVLKTQEMQT